MKKQAGLWIDHREAIVMFIEDDAEETKRIESGVEKHYSPKLPTGWPTSCPSTIETPRRGAGKYRNGICSASLEPMSRSDPTVSSSWLGAGCARKKCFKRLCRSDVPSTNDCSRRC